MRRGLFDVGFEDFGRQGGGLPHEAVFGGLGGLGGIMVQPTTIVRGNAYAYAGNPSSAQWDNVGGDIQFQPPAHLENINEKERVAVLHGRLYETGLRRDGSPPLLYDLGMHDQIVEFQDLVGLPVTGVVDQDTWVYLNYVAGLTDSGKFDPLAAKPAATSTAAAQINKTVPGANVATSYSSVIGSLFSNIVGGIYSAVGGASVTAGGSADRVPVKPKVPSTTGAQDTTVTPSTSNQLEQNAKTKETAITRPGVSSPPGAAAHYQRTKAKAAGAPATGAYGTFMKRMGGTTGLMIAALVLAFIIAVLGEKGR